MHAFNVETNIESRVGSIVTKCAFVRLGLGMYPNVFVQCLSGSELFRAESAGEELFLFVVMSVDVPHEASAVAHDLATVLTHYGEILLLMGFGNVTLEITIHSGNEKKTNLININKE